MRGRRDRPSTSPAIAAVVGTCTTAAPRLKVDVLAEADERCDRTAICEDDVIRIGSHPSNAVVLDDALVSRFHCAIRRDPRTGRWRVEDIGSLNGTSINGVFVRDADLPTPIAELVLGGSRVRVEVLSPASRVALAPGVVFGALHGKSEPMRRLFALIERVASSDASVLVEGESGSGKELVATEIAQRGKRGDGPFIIVDCGAIAPTLIESTFFGHRRGAFTGADRDHVGAFEAASGGTVFLDEIGELPLDLQPKLLRVIESRSIVRVGENERRPVNVRIIAATNRVLEREVNHGRFREDLYFRLSVVRIRVPPLRERIEDLELLVASLLDAIDAPAAGRAVFNPDVLAQMAQYDWPGNVRELRNFLERAVVLDRAPPASDMNGPLSQRPPAMGSLVIPTPERVDPTISANVDLDVPLRTAKEELVGRFERAYIGRLLASTEGNVSAAARRAGMDRINLHRLIQRYGLRISRSLKA